MKKLFEIVLVLQTCGGSAFFGALFVSNLPASTKVLAGIGLMFVSMAVFLIIVNQLATAESLRALTAHSTEQEGSLDASSAAVQSAITQIQGGLRMQTAGRLGYLMVGMFACWLIGGWAISGYVI